MEQASPSPVPVTPPTRERPVRPYDFRHPPQISGDRRRSLTGMHDLVARRVEGWLAGRLREETVVEVDSVEQGSFGGFLSRLPSPCAAYILSLAAQGGTQGVLQMDLDLAFRLVERFLGGSGEAPPVPPRPLTPIERRVVRIAADRVAGTADEVWRDYLALELGVTGFESLPETLEALPQEDPVLVGTFRVQVGPLRTHLRLCLPLLPLKPFFSGGRGRKGSVLHGSPDERKNEVAALAESVREARVLIQARLPEARVPVSVLSRLQEGNLVHLGLPTDVPLDVLVAGQKRFAGAPGRKGPALAVELLRPSPPVPPGRDAPLQPYTGEP